MRGGLPNLLWSIRKLDRISRASDRRLKGRSIHLLLPEAGLWDATRRFLIHTETDSAVKFDVSGVPYQDGVIFNDGLTVTAHHNTHMKKTGDAWRSFSFRIEAGGRTFVYSGDVRGPEELSSLLLEKADLVLMETGHHKVEDVCRYFETSGGTFGALVLSHHGRAILKDPDGELARARSILGEKVLIARDGMTYEL